VRRPTLFVVKATIAPELEAAFNHWYDTVRSKEAANPLPSGERAG
jgi:hypothetical protein